MLLFTFEQSGDLHSPSPNGDPSNDYCQFLYEYFCLAKRNIADTAVPDANKHFHVLYDEYCNTYESTTNTMELRTVGALALGPTGNTQGGVRCYSLRTGKILNRMMKDVTIAKMPEEALGRLKYITKEEKSVKGLTFGNRNNDDDAANTTGVLDGETNNDNTIDHVSIHQMHWKKTIMVNVRPIISMFLMALSCRMTRTRMRM